MKAIVVKLGSYCVDVPVCGRLSVRVPGGSVSDGKLPEEEMQATKMMTRTCDFDEDSSLENDRVWLCPRGRRQDTFH